MDGEELRNRGESANTKYLLLIKSHIFFLADSEFNFFLCNFKFNVPINYIPIFSSYADLSKVFIEKHT